jgi:hypothetical protein
VGTIQHGYTVASCAAVLSSEKQVYFPRLDALQKPVQSQNFSVFQIQ